MACRAGPGNQNAQRLCRSLEFKNAPLWPLGPGNLIYAHGTTIMSLLNLYIGERIFYALQVRTLTMKIVALKNIYCIIIVEKLMTDGDDRKIIITPTPQSK